MSMETEYYTEVEIETRMIIESGFLEEKLSFNGYGNVQLKMQFVLSEEDRNRIRFLRQSALQKKHEELVNGSIFTKSKSIASDLFSLSPMKTRDTASPQTNLGLSQETELKTNADREPVSSSLIMWKPKVSDTVEKMKTQPSSTDVSSRKKLSVVKNLENVSLVKQEDKGLSEPERNPKRNSMRRSMSEANLSSVRKMISTFEIKVTQDTKVRTAKIQTDSSKDAEEKTKVESQPETAVNLEKLEERKISLEDMEKSECKDNTERCVDLLPTVSRDESKLATEEKIKLTQDDTRIQTDPCKDAEEKTKAESQPESAVNLEKPEERKISLKDMEKSECRDNRERCHDLVNTVSRNESKSLEQSIRRSDSLSKERRKRSSVVEVRDEEKKPNKPVRLKDSQLENARGSRLWIFPDEAKDLSCETRHLDLEEANLLQKKTEGSTRENIGERDFRATKINSNKKWKNIERSKKEKPEASADSDSSRGPAGQVMRALIVVSFAGLVFLTRQRT